MINAVSKRKITHYVQSGKKRTLCGLSVAKGNWELGTYKVDHPKCESCERNKDIIETIDSILTNMEKNEAQAS